MSIDICYTRASLVFQKYCHDLFHKSLEIHDKKYENTQERIIKPLIFDNNIPSYNTGCSIRRSM